MYAFLKIGDVHYLISTVANPCHYINRSLECTREKSMLKLNLL